MGAWIGTRWAPVIANGEPDEPDADTHAVALRTPPAKVVGEPHPYAAAFADVLPESHRDALREAAIVYSTSVSPRSRKASLVKDPRTR